MNDLLLLDRNNICLLELSYICRYMEMHLIVILHLSVYGNVFADDINKYTALLVTHYHCL